MKEIRVQIGKKLYRLVEEREVEFEDLKEILNKYDVRLLQEKELEGF